MCIFARSWRVRVQLNAASLARRLKFCTSSRGPELVNRYLPLLSVQLEKNLASRSFCSIEPNMVSLVTLPLVVASIV